MNHKTLTLTALLLAPLAALGAADKPATAAKPNIVYMLADDFGWGDLRIELCWGQTCFSVFNL